jgi:ATP-dependent protease Clp ATPase subunit
MADAEATETCSFCGRAPEEKLWRAMADGRNATICAACIRACRLGLDRREAIAARKRRCAEGLGALLAAMSARVVGQVAACRALAAALLEHGDLIGRRDLDTSGEGSWRSPRVLLVGPPGTGKTTLCQALRDVSPWPVLSTHAERHTLLSVPAGSIDDAVVSLVTRANGDLVEAERGVVIVDGVDLVAPERDAALPDRREAVQREILRLLDGITFKTPYEECAVWSGGMLVVVALTLAASDMPAANETNERALRARLREKGLAPAFLARFDRVVALSPLDASGMKELLVRRGGAIEHARRVAENAGSGFEIGPPAIEAMAAAAARDPDGAWAVGRPFARLLEEVVSSSPRLWVIDESTAQRWIAA